jgi:hypothetical protein
VKWWISARATRELSAFAREKSARSANARTIHTVEQRKCLTFVVQCVVMHTDTQLQRALVAHIPGAQS